MKKTILTVIFMTLLYGNVYAANTALPDMTEDATPTGDDLIYTTNAPATTPADRKVTITNLQTVILTGNAGTATALAANGANCDAGSYALGVDASGASEGCTAAPTAASLAVDDLITLSGVAEGAAHLGTFTGSTITDNSTIKTALQELETAAENVTALTFSAAGFVGSDGAGNFDDFYPDGTTVEISTGTLQVKDAGITAAKLATDADDDAIEFVIDGGGSAITTGVKGCLEIPWAATISSALVTAPIESGSIEIDVWVDSYANFPLTVADTIVASAPIAMTTAQTGSSDLTGWTTAVAKGQWVCFNVTSVTDTTLATVSLKVDK